MRRFFRDGMIIVAVVGILLTFAVIATIATIIILDDGAPYRPVILYEPRNG